MDNRVELRSNGPQSVDADSKSDTGLNKVTYKATKLWQEVLEAFRNGVQLGKHRFLLRQYDNCFVASAAVTWFHDELEKRFEEGGGITRRQTLTLLQKFYKAGVFVPVTNHQISFSVNSTSTNQSIIKETDFKDNRRLYRLVEYVATPTETKDSFCTSKSTTPTNDYYVIINQLSAEQMSDIWKNVFVERFVQVVGYNVFTTFLKPGAVHGSIIKENMTNISSHGVVLVPPADDLPGWVMSAMKCATRGLADAEFQHSNYPGFENDVFGLIRDYFNTFKDTAPLLTFELHDAFVTTFVRAALFNGKDRLNFVPSLQKSNDKQSFSNSQRFVQEQYPFSVSDSTENLLLDMLTPSPKKVSKGIKIQNERPKPMETIHSPGNALDEMDFEFEAMPDYNYDIGKYKRFPAVPVSAAREPIFLETAFTSDRSPITRVISKAEIECSLGALKRPSTLKIGASSPKQLFAPPPALEADDYAYENPLLVLSPGDLVNHPKYSRIIDSATGTKVTSNASFEAALKSLEITDLEPGTSKAEIEMTRSLDQKILSKENQSAPTPSKLRPYRSHSAANLSDVGMDRTGGYVPPLPARSRASVDFGDEGFRSFLIKQFSSSPSRSAQKTVKMLSTTKVPPSIMNPEGKEFAIVSFRLLTLLLPSKNRRYLHLLLQFMAKIAGNQKFMLDVANTTRRIVINEFSRAIMGCSVKQEYDEHLAHQIVTFLMDHNAQIFDVTMEACLKQITEDQISEQQIEKVPMSQMLGNEGEDKENNPAFFACNKVSLDEYESQRLLGGGGTAQSLRELLSACDALPDAKERKRHLKKFRKEYPHIYAEKYGDSENSEIESSAEIEKEPSVPVQKKGNRIFRALF